QWIEADHLPVARDPAGELPVQTDQTAPVQGGRGLLDVGLLLRPLGGLRAVSGPTRLPARYAPVAPLGRGGGGGAGAGRDGITLRTVALKSLAEGAEEREVLALVREAMALSGVEGLGVPRVLRFGRLPDGKSYMVRELVEGKSLADLIASRAD